MHFELNKVYHVYSRKNSKQRIFFTKEHYACFIGLIKELILPHCELLAYCLMPNHFHLLILANEQTVAMDERDSSRFSEAIQELLRQYGKAANKRQGKVFSLIKTVENK